MSDARWGQNLSFGSTVAQRRRRADGKWPKVSLQEARERGLGHYWTGEVCRNGHMDYRQVISSKCLSCNEFDVKRHKAKKTCESNTSRALDIDRLKEELALKRELEA